MNIKEFIKKSLDKFARIFYWASGADYNVLKQVPTEKNKYFGIGGTVVFTALMATFAGGYAFFTAFKSVTASVFFGLFWGALIFNLDRYIVTTFGSGDGKKTISRQELFEAAPRLLMAVVLGIVISTPLELKLFEKEINAKINTEIAKVTSGIIIEGENNPIILRLQNEKNDLLININNRNQIINEKKEFWNKATKDKNDEWNLGKFSGKKGKGGYWAYLKKVADDAEREYTKIKEEDYPKLNQRDYDKIEIIDNKIQNQETEIVSDIEERKTIQEQNDGLLARLRAMDELTSENKSLFVAKWLVTFLFILIEIAPILFKMMTERGPYDDIIDRVKHEVKVNQMLLQSNLNQEINTAVKIHSDKTEQKLSAELLANKELLNSIATAQSEIAKIAIEQWKKEQMEKVKNDVSTMIKS